MRTRFNSSQRSALFSLEDGILSHGDHGWLAEAEGDVRLLPDGIVRWLFGEGFLAKASAGKSGYRLNERGRSALSEARKEERSRDDREAAYPKLHKVPLLLLAPAPHSEELDYLLVVPLTRNDVARHRSRLQHLPRLQAADSERFEFVQFRDEVFALPITPRLVELDLLPVQPDDLRFLGAGPENAEELGLRHCPDRGINYGSGWLQWFGGFDPESPLIVSSRIGIETFERLLRGSLS